jgi:hypothetical protein
MNWPFGVAMRKEENPILPQEVPELAAATRLYVIFHKMREAKDVCSAFSDSPVRFHRMAIWHGAISPNFPDFRPSFATLHPHSRLL